jgi:hypothetical protein
MHAGRKKKTVSDRKGEKLREKEDPEAEIPRRKKPSKEDEERQNPGKLLVTQPATNSRAFTTICLRLERRRLGRDTNKEEKLGELD